MPQGNLCKAIFQGHADKQWQERPDIYRLAPEGWQKGHPKKDPIEQATLPEDTAPPQAPDAWSKLRKQSWARLLRKVYEVDSFIYPKRKGARSVIAVIEDPKELVYRALATYTLPFLNAPTKALLPVASITERRLLLYDSHQFFMSIAFLMSPLSICTL